MGKFSYFLGIDQTGAATNQGQKAKPLKVCFAQKERGKWTVHTQTQTKTPLTLPCLSPTSLRLFLGKFGVTWPNPKLAIIADCVFGMPEEIFPTTPGNTPEENLWNLFSKTLNHRYDEALFGLKVSESFFSTFIASNKTPPKRECEKFSGSNSLFTTRPFQKNIQTGSYRIWRDMVCETSKPWLNIWPFVSKENFNGRTAWIFEGYPTFMWKQLLGLPTRNTLALIKLLSSGPFKSRFKFDSFSLLKADPDLSDAAVLALGGVILQDQNKLMTPFKGFWKLTTRSKEGWISGIEPPP